MRLGRLVGVIAAVGAAAAIVPASANAGISLQFNGNSEGAPIGGPVTSFSWGVNAPFSGVGGGATGRAKFKEVTLTKPVDSNSPLYPYNLRRVARLKKAQIFFDQPNSVDGLALCMDDVYITDYKLEDEAGDPDDLQETITLNYSRISYVIYLDGGPFNVTFDLKRGGVELTSSNPCPSST